MSKSADSEEIQATLLKLFRPGIAPNRLFKKIRKAHPKASKSEIVRAAFAAMISLADRDPDMALELHYFALTERGGAERKG